LNLGCSSLAENFNPLFSSQAHVAESGLQAAMQEATKQKVNKLDSSTECNSKEQTKEQVDLLKWMFNAQP
jgi:uncharacterized protein YdiU (UPF0061 family)